MAVVYLLWILPVDFCIYVGGMCHTGTTQHIVVAHKVRVSIYHGETEKGGVLLLVIVGRVEFRPAFEDVVKSKHNQ